MVARLRVSTSGTGAASDDYANGTPTAGRTLLSGGTGLPPTWGVGSVAATRQVLWIDNVNSPGLPLANGTLAAPYATLQQAINSAVIRGWPTVCLIIAPGVYPEAVAVPAAITTLALKGYQQDGFGGGPMTILGGDFVFTPPGPGVPATMSVTDVQITAAGITTAIPAADNLSLEFFNSYCAAAVAANEVILNYWHSIPFGNVGANVLATNWDGWSWGRFIQAGVVFLPAAYNRQFGELGMNVFVSAIVAAAVPVFPAPGSMVQVVVPVTDLRAGDYCIGRAAAGAAAQEYAFSFHSSAAGAATFTLTNLARVGGNFNDVFEVEVHHAMMAVQP